MDWTGVVEWRVVCSRMDTSRFKWTYASFYFTVFAPVCFFLFYAVVYLVSGKKNPVFGRKV